MDRVRSCLEMSRAVICGVDWRESGLESEEAVVSLLQVVDEAGTRERE